MNAPAKISQAPGSDCAAMLGHAERWRGQCINSFAQLEVIIEDLLKALQAGPKGSKIRTGELVGPAFGHLRELTGPKGPFARTGSAVSATLEDLAGWFEWRAHLTHGVLTVWRGNGGNWLLVFAHRPAGNTSVRYHALPWKDAQELRSLLDEKIDMLQANARSLAQSVLSKR